MQGEGRSTEIRQETGLDIRQGKGYKTGMKLVVMTGEWRHGRTWNGATNWAQGVANNKAHDRTGGWTMNEAL